MNKKSFLHIFNRKIEEKTEEKNKFKFVDSKIILFDYDLIIIHLVLISGTFLSNYSIENIKETFFSANFPNAFLLISYLS